MNKNEISLKNKDDIKNENLDIIQNFCKKNSFMNIHSEEISNYILELLISNTIAIEFVKNTEKKINNFSFVEIHRKLNNFLQLYNINHETDDFDRAENITPNFNYLKTDRNEKRYKIDIHKKAKNKRNFYANKVLFDLANINKLKQEEMTIKNKEIEDFLNKTYNMKNNLDLFEKNKIQYDFQKKNHNYWGTITQPKSNFIDRTSSLYNPLKKSKDIKHPIKTQDKIKKKKTIFKKKYTLAYKGFSKPLTEEMELPKKKQIMPILQMPFVELPQEEYKNKETEEIKRMREETLQMIQLKKEKLRLLEERRKNLENLDIKGKYTTDIEGKIVIINEISPDNLLKDFSPINTNQKELLPETPIKSLQEETQLLEKKAKKNIIFNREQKTTNYFHFPNFMFNNIKNNDDNANKDENKDKINLEDNSNKDNNKNFSNNKDNIINENNNKDNINNHKNSNNNIKDNKNHKKDINNNKNNNKESEKDNKKDINSNIDTVKEESLNSFPFSHPHRFGLNERIVISGSNFRIMEPSPGVNIQEKNSIKKGGINYYKMYHKYSLEEFNQALRETLYFEKSKLSGNFSNNNNITPIKKEELKNQNNNLKTIKIPLHHQYSDRNQKKFRKTFTEIFRNKKYLKSPMRTSTLNEKNPAYLKFILMHEDKNDNENNERKIKKLGKSSSYNNIFRRDISARSGIKLQKKKKFELNLMDNFNKDLIKGYLQDGGETNGLPRLPPKNNIYINNLMNNIKGMNRTMSNFYRTRQKRNINNDFIPRLSGNNFRNNIDKI